MPLPQLVTYTDFVYPYLPVVNEPALLEQLNAVILSTQENYLKKMLGTIEFQNFVNNYSGTVFTSPWIEFVNGANWIKQSKGVNITVKYPGIASVLSYYMYYEYIKSKQTVKMQSGEGVTKFQNASQVVPVDLAVDAYNKGVELTGFDCNNDLEEYNGTVYNFIEENENSFPNWDFKQIKKINFLGI